VLSHLKTPDKAFNTSLLDIKQRSCGDALKRPALIAGVLLRLLFTDSASATKTASKRLEHHYGGPTNTCVRIANIHYIGHWKTL
jgi:hypothetical protein